MSKLKQYEIDALVSIIRRQVTEETKAKNKAKFSKAQEEMQTIVDEMDELEKKMDELRELKNKKGNALAKKLGKGVHWNNFTDDFSAVENVNYLIDVRNEIIVNQIDASADMQEFVKKLVEKYSK